MELFITIIGIGLISILNIRAIAHIDRTLKRQRNKIVEEVFDALDMIAGQITDNRKVTDRKVGELRKRLRQARVDILNEVYVAQAMVRDDKKRRGLK